MTFGARALIRLGALKQNLRVIRDAAPAAKVMAVIKANAYGHGMQAVADTLVGVDALAVARLAEAVQLHECGVRKPIVLLAGVMTATELNEATTRGFEVVVHCVEQIEHLGRCFHRSPDILWDNASLCRRHFPGGAYGNDAQCAEP